VKLPQTFVVGAEAYSNGGQWKCGVKLLTELTAEAMMHNEISGDAKASS